MSISILIATYNQAQYLPQCLDSLLRQTYRDIEILCVDDGSTDDTWQVLQKYQDKDARISTWRQPSNQGQAKARNLALSHSTGDIVMFLDSDDWLADNATEIVADAFTKYTQADCILLNLRYVFADGTEKPYTHPSFEVMSGKDAFRKSLTWQIHGVYATRGNLHRAHPYDDTCRHYSDDNTTRIHYYLSKEVRCCEATYYYRQNPQSVSHCVNISQLEYLRANESMKKQLIQLGCDDAIISLYENERWINLIGVNLFFHRHVKAFSKEEHKQVLSEIKRVWKNIEVKRLFPRNKYKPGYYPFHFSWSLFRLEQRLFCLARTLLHR